MRISRSEPGLVVSAAAHAGLLLAMLIALTDARKFEDAKETVPIDIVTDSRLNEIMKGEKAAETVQPTPRVDKVAEKSEPKPLPPVAKAERDVEAPPPPLRRREVEPEDKPEGQPQKRVAALPPAPEPPARPVQPAPTPPVKPPAKAQAQPAPAEPEKVEPEEAEIVRPKPPVRPRPEKKLEEAEKAEAQPKKSPTPPERPKTQAKAEPKREPRLKVDQLAKLLAEKKADAPAAEAKDDKTPDKKAGKPRSGDETALQSKFDASSIARLLSREAPQRRASAGRQLTQTASLGAPTASAAHMSPTLQAQIDAYTVEHYRKCWQSSLAIDARAYVPRVEFRLTRDGALDGAPRLLNPSADPVERSRGEQAVGAVRRCSPMPIPAAFAPFYDYWRVTELDMKEDM